MLKRILQQRSRPHTDEKRVTKNMYKKRATRQFIDEPLMIEVPHIRPGVI